MSGIRWKESNQRAKENAGKRKRAETEGEPKGKVEENRGPDTGVRRNSVRGTVLVLVVSVQPMLSVYLIPSSYIHVCSRSLTPILLFPSK